MRVDEHKIALEEHVRKLDECIKEGLVENQRNIGYNVSQASVELFSIYMHRLNLSDMGERWDHRIFKRAYVKEQLPDFPNKTEILGLMKLIEEKRNILCYGKRRPEEEIRKVIDAFRELQKIIGE